MKCLNKQHAEGSGLMNKGQKQSHVDTLNSIGQMFIQLVWRNMEKVPLYSHGLLDSKKISSKEKTRTFNAT